MGELLLVKTLVVFLALSLFEVHSDKCLKEKCALLEMSGGKMCLVGFRVYSVVPDVC